MKQPTAGTGLDAIVRMLEESNKPMTFKGKYQYKDKVYRIKSSIRFWKNFFTKKSGYTVHITLENPFDD